MFSSKVKNLDVLPSITDTSPMKSLLLVKVLFDKVNFYHFEDVSRSRSFQKRPTKIQLKKNLFGMYMMGKGTKEELTKLRDVRDSQSRMLKGNNTAVSLFMTYFNILEEMSAIWGMVT